MGSGAVGYQFAFAGLAVLAAGADPNAGLPPRYLRTPEAARFLGLSGRTLEKHRTYGTGPRYSKIGGRVVYAIGDLQADAHARVALLEQRGFSAEDFAFSHPGGKLGRRLLLKVGDIMHAGGELPRVTADKPLRHALLEMTQKGFGLTTVVSADGELLGGQLVGLPLRLGVAEIRRGMIVPDAAG